MTNPTKNSEQRLNKYLALQLGVSRREADNLIGQGYIKINGQIAKLGARFLIKDAILINDQPVKDTARLEYLAFHKPTGYICSRKQQGKTPTIYSLLPKKYFNLRPVGRLDKDSSGLILLTNDGDFAYKMTHPSFHKTKIYEATLDKPLEPLHQQMIADYGITLKDGVSQLQLEKIGETRKKWIITMHEGRNRQIRRTFLILGYSVVSLHRTNFGNYALGDIPPGKFQNIILKKST